MIYIFITKILLDAGQNQIKKRLFHIILVDETSNRFDILHEP